MSVGVLRIHVPTDAGQIAQAGDQVFEVKMNVKQGGHFIGVGAGFEESIGNLKMRGVPGGHKERRLAPDGVHVLAVSKDADSFE